MLKQLLKIPRLDKKMKLYLAAGLTGIIILIIFSGQAEKEPPPASESFSLSEYKSLTESSLCEVIEAIDGVSAAKAVITFKDSGKTEYLSDEKLNMESGDGEIINQERETAAAIKRENGSEEAIVTRTLMPEIKGVAVVADASSPAAEYKISETVKGALGVKANQIQIIINERD